MKRSINLCSKITNLFSLKGAICLRAQGLLLINRYKFYQKKSVGMNCFLIYLVAIVPVSFLKICKKIYYKYHN